MAEPKIYMARIVHEISNSLNSVDTGVQLLERRIGNQSECRGSDTAALARELREELSGLKGLICELQSFSQPLRMEAEPVDLVAVVERILRVQGPRCKEQGVELIWEIDGDLSMVLGDAGKLGQVVRNLCNNAVEAMPEGGTLMIRGYEVVGHVALEISDTGMGIPPGVDVFEEFTTTKANGTGLGLTIVKGIIAAHRGDISYTSEQAQGTSFRVTLPALFYPCAEDARQERSAA